MCLERSVHFPHPPSPSNGMGVVYVSLFLDLDIVDLSGVGSKVCTFDTSPDNLPNTPFPVLLLPELVAVTRPINLGTKLTPTAKMNATNAVLNTSDNNTVKKDDHTLLEEGAR